MQLQDIGNAVLFEMREPGVNWGSAPTIPASADYNQGAIAQYASRGIIEFILKTGYSPNVMDKYLVLPATAGLDYALPTDLRALIRMEYASGQGGAFIPLTQLSFDEYDAQTGVYTTVQQTGQPQAYRQPFGPLGAMIVRFNPYPTFANAGIASGTIQYTNTPGVGDTVISNFVSGVTHVNTNPYTVNATDTLYTIAVGAAAAINVSGAAAFLGPAVASTSGSVTFPSLVSGTPGNAITYAGTIMTSKSLKATPSVATNLAGGGPPDQIGIYYTTKGIQLVNWTDVPNIPDDFHEALIYYTLSRMWRRKNDQNYSDYYRKQFEEFIAPARALYFNVNQAESFGMADDDLTIDGSGYALFDND